MISSRKPNPRLDILREEVERDMFSPMRTHGWSVNIVAEHDAHSSLEFEAKKGEHLIRLAVLYSTGTENQHYKLLEKRVERIFFRGQAYMLESFAQGVRIPVESIADFFPYLVELNKQSEPDRSSSKPPQKLRVRRITEENPLEGIFMRLGQFTSINLAVKLVQRRANDAAVELSAQDVRTKAEGIAYSMRNALDYVTSSATEKLNKRILGLYYGTMAFAFAEMLAKPTGPNSLDVIEGMTRQGHGLYTYAESGFNELRVGVLAEGFMTRWLDMLGHDTAGFPRRKAKSTEDFGRLPADSWCTLEQLFSSMPEIDDLFSEVFGSAQGWLTPGYDNEANPHTVVLQTKRKASSAYACLYDRSSLVSLQRVESAGWPLAELRIKGKGDEGQVFSARVDHAGHDIWWSALPTHSSPFAHRTTLLLPTIGGMTEYRTIAAATLYALSIMVRYMPSAWRRIEGGTDDQYLALVKASLNVWERVLPEQFLQSIVNEQVYSGQPGGFFS